MVSMMNESPVVQTQHRLRETINQSFSSQATSHQADSTKLDKPHGANELGSEMPMQRRARPPATSTGAPVVQRALNASDASAFEVWLAAQELEKRDMDFAGIVRDASDLSHAKSLALEAASRSLSDKRARLLRDQLARRERQARLKGEEVNPAELQTIQDVMAELGAVGLGRAVSASIASLAEVLMAHYPPGSHTYVLIGNSPAPLLAWLQLNGFGEAACHLPLGGLTTPEGTRAMSEAGTERVQTAVSGYLDSALGPAVAKKKPLVLVDYVSTGGSLAATATFVKQWLAARGVDLPVFILGYSEKGPDQLDELMQAGHEGILATAVGRLEKAFTKLNADKLIKKALLLKGPASVDIVDLLRAADPAAAVVGHPEHWARLVRMMAALRSE
jgi:hypothetical protein